MGEFALHEGIRIKLGTCEDLLYLRADQAHEVTLLDENAKPITGEAARRALDVYRFRFPWPDEDDELPGCFAGTASDRTLALPGVRPPTVKHHTVSFSEHGYLAKLPCPEGAERLEGITVARTLDCPPAVALYQQRYWQGRLVGVCQCSACECVWRLETLADVEPVLAALARSAQNGNASFLSAVAQRLRSGYELAPGEFAGFHGSA